MYRSLWIAAAFAACLVSGCGGGGVDAVTEALSDRLASQRGATNAQVTDMLADATMEALTTSTASGRVFSLTDLPSFDFDTLKTLDKTVDLDMKDDNNQDMFPNATGTLNVSGTGIVSTSTEPKTAKLDNLQIKALTNVVLTDSQSGAMVTVAKDTVMGGAADLTAQTPTVQGGSVRAKVTGKLTNATVTVKKTDESSPIAVTVTAQNQTTYQWIRTDQTTVATSYQVVGGGTANWTERRLPVVVSWTTVASGPPAASAVTITYNNKTLGPYSFQQLANELGLSIGTTPS